jgi:hypothetical protein
LPWLDTTVPAHIGGAIRVGTGKVRVPKVNYTIVDVSPTYIPTVNCTATCIGDFNIGSGSATPVIGNYILTTGSLRQRTLRCKQAGTQKYRHAKAF